MRTGFYLAPLLMAFERRLEFRIPSCHLQYSIIPSDAFLFVLQRMPSLNYKNLVGSNSRVFHLFVPPNLVIIGTVEVKAMHMIYLPPSPPRENYSHPSPFPPSPLPPPAGRMWVLLASCVLNTGSKYECISSYVFYDRIDRNWISHRIDILFIISIFPNQTSVCAGQ